MTAHPPNGSNAEHVGGAEHFGDKSAVRCRVLAIEPSGDQVEHVAPTDLGVGVRVRVRERIGKRVRG